jgi:FkbM family methyltransferase
MKIIRIILFKILGLKTYLRLVSKIYILYIKAGCGKKKYPELFYLKTLIKKDDTCIDIGANLGYYSAFLKGLIGPDGKVYAVEPVPMFAEIWKKNTKYRKSQNLVLFNCALGESPCTVEMGMPVIAGVAHHGMTKILSDSNQDYHQKFSVEMKNPDRLFAEIEKINFIKIDVEGYESIVFKNMTETLIKHKPLIQSELSGDENRNTVISLLKSLDYSVYVLTNNQLTEANEDICKSHTGDFYFKSSGRK